MTKNSMLKNGFIWFGAAVSVAEIITGTYFAPLGFAKGLAAIITGHLIGGVMFFFCGLQGAQKKLSSMQCVSLSFGKKGALFFSVINVLQLLGWTSIMIYDGAVSAVAIAGKSHLVWCVVIGLLIFIWIFSGAKDSVSFSRVAVALLFCLSVVMCAVIFLRWKNGGENIQLKKISDDDILSFGAAVELSVAMPLSWLPLVSDYTRESEKPFAETLCSTLTYSFTSIWMYAIGMCAAIFTGENDIAKIMIKCGLGFLSLVILVLSTVTTTFLDSWSAGISCEVISKKINAKIAALIVTLTGTVLAVLFPMDDITDFLYLIGSVFAPMASVLVSDFIIEKKSGIKQTRENSVGQKKLMGLKIDSALIWIFGFVLYRVLMRFDFILGCTLVDILVVMLVNFVFKKLSFE